MRLLQRWLGNDKVCEPHCREGKEEEMDRDTKKIELKGFGNTVAPLFSFTVSFRI